MTDWTFIIMVVCIVAGMSIIVKNNYSHRPRRSFDKDDRFNHHVTKNTGRYHK